MKVDLITWSERMNNLNDRRAKETILNAIPEVDNYNAHIRKAYIGKKVLDVGCGMCIIKDLLPEGTEYTGIDPFPMREGVVKMKIEECSFYAGQFETVYGFAMLDNLIDLELALENIKRISSRNVLFLTGVNIPPDKYHTIEINEEVLIENMKPFEVTYKEYLHPKIMLIEFSK